MTRIPFVMNTRYFLGAAAAVAVLAVRALAQSPAPSPVVTPSAAPVIGAAAPAPAPNQMVYAQRLPTAAELTNAAAAQGQAVERIEQTPTQVTAIFRQGSGQLNTVIYQLLPTAGSTPAPTAVIPAQPPATVVYETAPRVIYYDYDPYYYPRYWYPPVSLNFGFGYRSGGFHRHGHGWRR